MTLTDLTVAQPTFPGLEYTPIGAVTDGLDHDDTITALLHIRKAGAAWRWIVGDLVLNLVDRDTSRLHEAWQAIADLGLDDRASLMKSVVIAYAVPMERRRAGLSWSHHVAVAPLDPDDQDWWLTKALDDGLTVSALEQLIAVEQAGEAPDELPDSGPRPFTIPARVLATVASAWGDDPNPESTVVLYRVDGAVRAEVRTP